MSRFKAGDVVTYTSERESLHCREGQAIADDITGKLTLFDTFWGERFDWSVSHVLTDAETATAVVQWNLTDYDALPEHPRAGSREQWQKYAEADRAVIHSQHWLQNRYYIRKGAVEDHATQVENARERLRDAADKLVSARHAVERAQRDLDELLQRAAVSS